MVDAFFSEITGVKSTLLDLKDAGFIHWYMMKTMGKVLSMTFVHTAVSSKSAGTTLRIYFLSLRNLIKRKNNIKGFQSFIIIFARANKGSHVGCGHKTIEKYLEQVGFNSIE
jgi:hypothetical protein